MGGYKRGEWTVWWEPIIPRIHLIGPWVIYHLCFFIVSLIKFLQLVSNLHYILLVENVPTPCSNTRFLVLRGWHFFIPQTTGSGLSFYHNFLTMFMLGSPTPPSWLSLLSDVTQTGVCMTYSETDQQPGPTKIYMEVEACSCAWRQRMFFAAIAEGARGVFRVFVIRMTLALTLPISGRILGVVKCLCKNRPVTRSIASMDKNFNDHMVSSL